MFRHVLEDRGVQFVAHVLSVALTDDELRVPQDAQVPRNGGPTRGKLLRDLPRGARAVAEELEDRAAGRIGERAKGRLHGHRRVRHLANKLIVPAPPSRASGAGRTGSRTWSAPPARSGGSARRSGGSGPLPGRTRASS